MTRPDFAVVGGGLLGRCLAWRASKAGACVALYDAGSSQGEGSAAWAAAGMIAPTTEAIDADAQIASIGRHSLSLGHNGWLSCRYRSSFEIMERYCCGTARMLEKPAARREYSPRGSRKRM